MKKPEEISSEIKNESMVSTPFTIIQNRPFFAGQSTKAR
jgi:hypothetical protein